MAGGGGGYSANGALALEAGSTLSGVRTFGDASMIPITVSETTADNTPVPTNPLIPGGGGPGGTSTNSSGLGTPVLPPNPPPIPIPQLPTLKPPTTIVTAPVPKGMVWSQPTMVVPQTPSLPTFEPPEMEMPKLPKLSEIAAAPFMGSHEIWQERKRQEDTIAKRVGRKNTFLTPLEARPRAAMPMTLAARRDDYRRTAG